MKYESAYNKMAMSFFSSERTVTPKFGTRRELKHFCLRAEKKALKLQERDWSDSNVGMVAVRCRGDMEINDAESLLILSFCDYV